jgi:uroporphyrinogen III methyltransferase/synthase
MKDSSPFPRASSLVSLVGAGPGDPKLLTIRGREVLEQADVILHDALIDAELLKFAREDAEKIFVGKRAGHHALSQDEINALIIEKARENKIVCRLKGGDPFVFGRGGEEALACFENNIAFEIVPGISSAIAALAYAGIPVTHREISKSFAVVTGHTKEDDAPPEKLPVADTLVFLMGVRALTKIVQSLVAQGRERSTPVALVRWGTTMQQQVVTGTLETIEAEIERAQLKPPALIVVGEVVKLREKLAWFDDASTRPLWGQTVVVTRAREQASSLVEHLEKMGAQVLQCPTIQIVSLEEGEYSALDEAIENIKSYDWIVFTSSNGVEKFWQRLRHFEKDARSFGDAKMAAIGPATQAALQAHGLIADFVPESSISENVAAGLLELGVKKVLISRAVESREVLEEKLRAGGAWVEIAPCYRNAPDVSQAEVVREKLARGEINWITFTSSSTVTNFVAAMGGEVLSAHRKSFHVACIGPITEKTARENGLTPDIVAREASVESLALALVEAS